MGASSHYTQRELTAQQWLNPNHSHTFLNLGKEDHTPSCASADAGISELLKISSTKRLLVDKETTRTQCKHVSTRWLITHETRPVHLGKGQHDNCSVNFDDPLNDTSVFSRYTCSARTFWGLGWQGLLFLPPGM
jgi:hypothetical protein